MKFNKTKKLLILPVLTSSILLTGCEPSNYITDSISDDVYTYSLFEWDYAGHGELDPNQCTTIYTTNMMRIVTNDHWSNGHIDNWDEGANIVSGTAHAELYDAMDYPIYKSYGALNFSLNYNDTLIDDIYFPEGTWAIETFMAGFDYWLKDLKITSAHQDFYQYDDATGSGGINDCYYIYFLTLFNDDYTGNKLKAGTADEEIQVINSKTQSNLKSGGSALKMGVAKFDFIKDYASRTSDLDANMNRKELIKKIATDKNHKHLINKYFNELRSAMPQKGEVVDLSKIETSSKLPAKLKTAAANTIKFKSLLTKYKDSMLKK